MQDPTRDDAAPPDGGPVRLNGWKDIAAHLDRGVRTVQRWEKEFGLPVRRLGNGRSEGVFGFAHEIDAWQATAQAARARREHPPGANESPAESEPDPASRRLRIAVGVMACAVVLAVAWAGWSTWRAFGPLRQAESLAAAAGQPASWRVEVDSLVVLDGAGRTCWTRQLSTDVDAGFYARQAQVPSATGGVGDIDHDGRREVWIIVVPSSPNPTHAKLHLFNEDGTSRWEYQHAGTATFGSMTYGGPWVVHRAFLTEAPEDSGGHALWVSSRDVSEYPSLLVRLDIATGRPVGGPYWSNGWVGSVALLRSPGGQRLLVGVTNNDQRAPGVAMLDATNISSTAPSEQAKYRCTTCPSGDPLAVAVFPKPRRFESSPGGGAVNSVSSGGPAAPITVTVTYAITSAGVAAAAVFRLDTALRPLQADTTDGYVPAYEHLVRAGEVPAFGPLPKDPASELLPILVWDAAAQRYVKTPLSTRSR